MKIAVVDYGMGNLSSVAKAFETLHVDVTVTRDPRELESADRLVLPGVGAFAEGMRSLVRFDLIGPLADQVLHRKKPLLGICLGMQLLGQESSEHGRHEGLGWVPGSVDAFRNGGSELKSVHIGWSDVVVSGESPLFVGLGVRPSFYFVHRYYMVCDEPGIVTARSRYGVPFVAALQRDNICGVQFHPEKSQETGLGLLRRFVTWAPDRDAAAVSSSAEPPDETTPKVRVVPTLLLNGSRLTKTVRFELMAGGLRRDVGDPVKAPMVYDAQLADELVYLDIRASLEGRNISRLEDVVGRVAGTCFMPLTAGGGVRSTEDIRCLLKAGADKVAVNSAAVERPAFITEAAARFGSQCVVVSIDARRNGRGYSVTTHSATRTSGLDPVAWAQEAARLGAGEILLTAVDRDGTMEGYDLDLTSRVANAVDIPVIVSGGAGKLLDLAQGVTVGKASAVAAASLFHFTDQSPIKAKAFLRREEIPVR